MELNQAQLDTFIDRAIAEDEGAGDHTSNACIGQDQESTAELLIKDVGVMAGIEIAEYLFKRLDPDCYFEVKSKDGEDIEPGKIGFRLRANTRKILLGERLVLNLLQHLSGIATLSSRFALEVEDLDVTILDTRKTTPLLRFLEKWAVEIGGCTNYRNGLYDWILIKDNHIDSCGSISAAIEQVHQYLQREKLDLGITVEVRNLVEVHEAVSKGGVDRIMLDNFELPLLREAVATIDGQFETEASGGILLQNVRKVAETGVDFISVGALTHSAGALDMSLKMVEG